MTQAELNRAVARATGDSVSTICKLGFVPLMAVPFEREPRTVDWEAADARRNLSLKPRRKRAPAVI